MSEFAEPTGTDLSEADRGLVTPVRPAGGPRRSLFAVLVTVGVTGGALALYHRPSGRGFWAGTHPGRLGIHVQLERLLAWGHRAASLILVLVAAVWIYRTWRRRGWSGSVGAMGWAAVVLSSTLTAFFVPWEQFLPWSDVVTVAHLEPTRLGEGEGPFPELMALRAQYPKGAADLAWPSNLRSRRGSVLAWVHVLVGPLGALAALFVRRMNRVRQSKDA